MICECIIFNQERYPKIQSFIDKNNKLLSLPLEDNPYISKEMLIPLTKNSLNKYNE